ncbi:DUF3180 family protein [Brevibacterium senegalense]|uniref:DUF3180 family protein n=1 Tax=Brevibacterium senegalense TaxID=1033736 RepID=UPI0002F738C9|nr:DUF3180 family protein [Brevibacterium senegalense]
MKRTRPGQLLLWGGTGLVVSLGFHAVWERAGNALPDVPWPAIVGMLVLAGALLALGWPVRAWRDGDRTSQIDVIRAARIAMLARAAALAGALLTAWYLGGAVYLLASVVGLRTEAAMGMLAASVSAAILMAVGLIVESFCSLPPDDPRALDDDHPGTSRRTDPPEAPA